MADSDYVFALSLTVCEPRLDSQSNTVSWPVIRWYCDLDLSNEISVEEAEALFGIKVRFSAHGSVYRVPKKQFSTIVELNTMYGFDSTLKGTDICEYFDLPRMEIFEDPVTSKYRNGELIFGILCSHTLLKKHTDCKINQITLPASDHDHKDTTDATLVVDIQVEKEPSTSHAGNQLILVVIALIIVLFLLVIYLSIKE